MAVEEGPSVRWPFVDGFFSASAAPAGFDRREEARDEPPDRDEPDDEDDDERDEPDDEDDDDEADPDDDDRDDREDAFVEVTPPPLVALGE